MFSTRIDPTLHKAVKMLAVEKDKPLSEIAEEALGDLLKKNIKKKYQNNILLQKDTDSPEVCNRTIAFHNVITLNLLKT